MNWFKRLLAPKYTDRNGFEWIYEHPYWWIELTRNNDNQTYTMYASVLDVEKELDETVQDFMAHNTRNMEK